MSHTESRYSNITVVQRVTPALRVVRSGSALDLKQFYFSAFLLIVLSAYFKHNLCRKFRTYSPKS